MTPYDEYKTHRYWHTVNDSVDALIKNGDIVEKTAREYIVGYVVKQLIETENRNSEKNAKPGDQNDPSR